MAAPLSLTVDTASRKRTFRRPAAALAGSLALQGTALVFLGVTPLLNYEGLPEPQPASPPRTYVAAMPVIPVASERPRGGAPRRGKRIKKPSLSDIHWNHVVPEDIPLEDDGFEDPFAGLPIGVEGGAPWIPGAVPPPEPPPDPAPVEPVRIGRGVRTPHKERHVNPVYPPVALQARIEGTVVLEATIDEAGNVTDLRVLRSIPLLDGAAMDAVRQWKYAPTLLGGRPVPVLLTVTVTFDLKR